MTKSPKKYQTWKHRIAAVLFGVLVVVAVEVLCRIAGWGEADAHLDPFVSFRSVTPLFELNADTQRYETRTERIPFFVRDSFAATKEENAVRIFCLGGSTVQGRPYSIETAFPMWLRIALESAYPDRAFEVVNCGGISYASYRLVPILSECLNYEPDLFILCTGHNEFLEGRTYGGFKFWSGPIGYVARPLSRLHLYRGLASLTTNQSELEDPRPALKSEVDALLDYRGGLDAYQRDDEWRIGVMEHFEQNVIRMIRLANDRKVPMLVLAPPVNLKDCPPFKSVATAGLATGESEQRDQFLVEAGKARRKSPQESARLLAKATAIDPDNSGIHYALGQAYLACSESGRARESLVEAMEEDICPLRMLESMRSRSKRLCESTGTRFIDIQAILEEEEGVAVIGNGLLVDHVHPSIRGHQLIAEKIVENLDGWLAFGNKDEQWAERKAAAFERHLATLDDLYYAKGRQRLENLKLWTEGRTDGLPVELHQRAQPLRQ